MTRTGRAAVVALLEAVNTGAGVAAASPLERRIAFLVRTDDRPAVSRIRVSDRVVCCAPGASRRLAAFVTSADDGPRLLGGRTGADEGSSNVRKENRVSTRCAVLAAVAVMGATMLTSAADGQPVAAKQRISIVVDGKTGSFILSPLSTGNLLRDTGKVTDCCYGQQHIMRDGQSININNPLSTFTGTQGRLVVRFRIEWADAGNGYTAGNGTWKIVGGTGAYARLTGAGRSGHVWVPRGYAGTRSEGFVGPKPG